MPAAEPKSVMDAENVTLIYVPVADKFPDESRRFAVSAVRDGGEYATTVIDCVVLAVRPRESVTDAVIFRLPVHGSVSETTDADVPAVYFFPSIVTS